MKESELIFRTRPDTLKSGLAIQRITQVRHEGDVVRTFPGGHAEERMVRMPQLMARRIFRAATILGKEKPGSLESYNCHRFTRTIGGFEDDFAPVYDSVSGLPEAMRLPLGAIGLHHKATGKRRFDGMISFIAS